MSLVATLICNPATPALDSTAIDAARAILPDAQAAHWLFEGVAADIPFAATDDCARRRGAAARGGRRPAGRRRRAAADRAAQEAVPRRHGLHHDRPGMHRRARRLCRAEGACRGDHRAGDARRDRVRAGAARARRAAQGPAGRHRRRDDRQAHHADAGRPRTGQHHAQARRLHLPRLRRLHAVHQRDRREDRLSGEPRQRADRRGRQVLRHGRPSRSSARRRSSRRTTSCASSSSSTTSTRWRSATAPTTCR